MRFEEKVEAKIEAVAILMAMADKDIKGFQFLVGSLKTERELRTALVSMSNIALSLLEQAYEDPQVLVRQWAELLVSEAVAYQQPGNVDKRRRDRGDS